MNRLGLAFADTAPSGDKPVDIHIKTIAHADQPYDTAGMWSFDAPEAGGMLCIAVSDTGNPDYAFLVALHEMVEAFLCQKRGISERIVTAFDELFEAERAAGKHSADDEPGDDRRAPYHSQHRFATKIEKRVAAALGVNWPEYEAAINALDQGEGK